MADGFHTKDIDKLCRIRCQFFRKENYNEENHKHKTEKTYFINIFTIHKYSLKEFATNVILYCLLPSKGKYKHITILQLDATC